ncbi:hypothetical protein AFLA_012783 [Aspergillus flavus NRRL3357]|nr:hypothetical protein AFLA_012783 [Aspergillus flavus NRRL3357]
MERSANFYGYVTRDSRSTSLSISNSTRRIIEMRDFSRYESRNCVCKGVSGSDDLTPNGWYLLGGWTIRKTLRVPARRNLPLPRAESPANHSVSRWKD